MAFSLGFAMTLFTLTRGTWVPQCFIEFFLFYFLFFIFLGFTWTKIIDKMEIDKNNKILKPKKLMEFQRKKVKMKIFRFSLITMKIETK